MCGQGDFPDAWRRVTRDALSGVTHSHSAVQIGRDFLDPNPSLPARNVDGGACGGAGARSVIDLLCLNVELAACSTLLDRTRRGAAGSPSNLLGSHPKF